ncbi:hypothetical protein PFLUV_G00238590 [Perca fluviatilis]|uniref:Uncharacterized protein n=1 Tax=Perca fluviatilis TaxID=8168 RepID=A0A6A5DPN1_PERFL|nr:hypothetical protein PFLUV_G00238590 [Perca fluviatilis]
MASTLCYPGNRDTYREGVYIAEHLGQTGLLSAVDMVEVNPLRVKVTGRPVHSQHGRGSAARMFRTPP